MSQSSDSMYVFDKRVKELCIPGQVAVLLQVRVSLNGPLHNVPYGDDTQFRVRTWVP